MSVLSNWNMKCPKCGAADRLDVQASVWVRLTGDGTDADASQDGNHEWDEKSSCSCQACDWSGTVKDAETAAA